MGGGSCERWQVDSGSQGSGERGAGRPFLSSSWVLARLRALACPAAPVARHRVCVQPPRGLSQRSPPPARSCVRRVTGEQDRLEQPAPDAGPCRVRAVGTVPVLCGMIPHQGRPSSARRRERPQGSRLRVPWTPQAGAERRVSALSDRPSPLGPHPLWRQVLGPGRPRVTGKGKPPSSSLLWLLKKAWGRGDRKLCGFVFT